jgi:hypothetical protein
MEGPRLILDKDKGFFFPPKRPDRLWRPSSLLSVCTGGSFPGNKKAGREVDQSPPSSSEVKNEWIYTSTSHIHAFMAWTETSYNRTTNKKCSFCLWADL